MTLKYPVQLLFSITAIKNNYKNNDNNNNNYSNNNNNAMQPQVGYDDIKKSPKLK